MQLYAITDRRLFAGDERTRCATLLRQAARWMDAGVEFIQLREKDLPASALAELAGQLVNFARQAGRGGRSQTRILVNAGGVAHSRDIGRRVGMHGVHLPASGVPAACENLKELRQAWHGDPPVVSVACHTPDEARQAAQSGASLILFAPVFEKPIWNGGAILPGLLAGVGVGSLASACEAAWPVPVFALGGVSVSNAAECIDAGASGIAGIRLFSGDAWLALTGR